MLIDLVFMLLSFIVLIVLLVIQVKTNRDGVREKKSIGHMLTCVNDETKICTKSLCPPDDPNKGLSVFNNMNGVRNCCVYKDYMQQSVEKS